MTEPIYIKIPDPKAAEWLSNILTNTLKYPSPSAENYLVEIQQLVDALANPISIDELIRSNSTIDRLATPQATRSVKKTTSTKRKKKPALTKEDRNNPLICNDHPTYGGGRRPSRDCDSCWNVYKQFHPMEYAAKRRIFEREMRNNGK